VHKAPAYAGSRKGSHHLGCCTQPYSVFLNKRLFPRLDPYPFSHMTTTLTLRQGSPLTLIDTICHFIDASWFIDAKPFYHAPYGGCGCFV